MKKINKYFFEKFKCILTITSPTLCSKFLYFVVFKKKINLKNPKTFNEKLMWLKLNTYYDNELIDICVDKYRVRDYLKEKKCDEILNDLLFCCDNPDEINWDLLPQKFAIKCNHGCGYNIICDNKDKLDKNNVEKQLNKWLKDDFWKHNAEVNYKNVPKKIIIEKYIETSDGFVPNDYKVYCFNGVPKLVLVCTERASSLKLSWFDLDWNLLDIGANEPDISIKKPESLDKMIKYSSILAKDFPFVRIDFYECDSNPIFGEMTFSPAGCLAQYYSKDGIKKLSEYLDISNLINGDKK